MVENARVAELIRERRMHEVSDAIAEGEFFEMQTFTRALIDLVLQGLVEEEVAADAATNRHDFMIALSHAQKAARVASQAPVTAPPPPGWTPAPDEVDGDDDLPALRLASS
jgi:Tfp pilus assembly ATPase PilU